MWPVELYCIRLLMACAANMPSLPRALTIDNLGPVTAVAPPCAHAVISPPHTKGVATLGMARTRKWTFVAIFCVIQVIMLEGVARLTFRFAPKLEKYRQLLR